MADESKQHTEIMLALGRLEGKTETGLISINQHLAQLNSKVAAHEGRLNHMDVEDGKLAVLLENWKEERKSENSLRAKWMDRSIMLVITILLNLGLVLLARTGIVNLEKEPQTLEDIQKQAIELEAKAKQLHVDELNQKDGI